jgi:hypothetical protein
MKVGQRKSQVAARPGQVVTFFLHPGSVVGLKGFSSEDGLSR